jgi:DNA polymerase elongation subunit (family B)
MSRKYLTESEKDIIHTSPELSSRKLAMQLRGKRSWKSTINDYRKRIIQVKPKDSKSFNGGPRILSIDIETAPVMGFVWGLWNNNVGLNQIAKDWYILSYSAKWMGSDEVIYRDQRFAVDVEDDLDIIQDIWALLDEADIIIAHNGRRFDNRKIRARMILNGMSPPSSYRQIDTLEIAKRQFAFTSNKLEYLTDQLCVKHKKLKHKNYPGFELWAACMKGDVAAFDEMKEYNIVDVLSLEELFFIMAPWSNQLPNLDTYHLDGHNHCYCGSADFEHIGYHHTNSSLFNKYQCKSCGAEKRDRTNIIDKNDRAKLLSNVI